MPTPSRVIPSPLQFIIVLVLVALGISACVKDNDTVVPILSDITESVYASGVIKSKNQYQVYSTISGIVDSVYVVEGDTVSAGSVLLTVSNETQQLNKQNAKLALDFDAIGANQGRLAEARQAIEVARGKLLNDSLLFTRQQTLFQKSVGNKVDVEQRELSFQNSKLSYISARERYDNLKRQIDLAAVRSKNNLKIASTLQNDFTVRSMMDGRVYGVNVTRGEIVTPQMPLAIVGDAHQFVLEMQVDERDINKVVLGMRVVVTLNSEKNTVYEATVTKIYPLMNSQSKSFLVEAEFAAQPSSLYPNVTFEANIVVQTKKNVLVIPRKYLVDDGYVWLQNGDRVKVQPGLMDFNNVEILSGITETDHLMKPTK